MSSSPSTRTKLITADKPLPSGYGAEGTTGAPKVFATDLYEDGYDDPVYHAKARILNRSIQEIGMGKYQVW
jgi:hypothetical protein